MITDTSDLPSAPQYKRGNPRYVRSKLTTLTIMMGAIALAIHLLRTMEPVLLPILLAFLMAMVLWPLLRRLRRLGLPKPLASALILLFVVGGLLATLYGLSGPAADWIRRAPSSFSLVENRLRELKRPIQELKEATESVEQAARIESDASKGEVTVKVEEQSLLELAVESAPSAMQQVLISVMSLFFFLAWGDVFLRHVSSITLDNTIRNGVADKLKEVQRDVSQHLVTITIINASFGVLVALILFLLGYPNPTLWGFAVALLNFAPYVGALIALAGLFIVGMVSFDVLTPVVLGVGGVAVLTTLEGYLVTPSILGKRLALDPLAIFLSMVFWGWLWGVAGLLMAVPLLVCLRIFWKTTRGQRSSRTTTDTMTSQSV